MGIRSGDQAGLLGRGRGSERRLGRHRPTWGVSLHPWHPSADVPQASVDHAPVLRLRHRRRDPRTFPLPHPSRPDRAQRGLRPAHPMRPRLRRSHGRRRGGPGGHGGRHPGRHGGGLRRHRPQQDHGLPDHQRRRGPDHGHVLRHGPQARFRPGGAARHGSERHPEGNHRPRHLDLSGGALHPPGGRHDRVLRPARPQVLSGQHLRLPHSGIRGDAGPGDSLRPGDRQGLYRPCARARRGRRRLCWPAVVQLRHPRQPVGAGRPSSVPDGGCGRRS